MLNWSAQCQINFPYVAQRLQINPYALASRAVPFDHYLAPTQIWDVPPEFSISTQQQNGGPMEVPSGTKNHADKYSLRKYLFDKPDPQVRLADSSHYPMLFHTTAAIQSRLF
jgi:hypothetical protein